VKRRFATLPDRCDDVRVVVAHGGAHLARREVENLPAACIEDVAALRPFHNFRIGVAAVADQVLAKILRGVAHDDQSTVRPRF
jgi:hypothetical protein